MKIFYYEKTIGRRGAFGHYGCSRICQYEDQFKEERAGKKDRKETGTKKGLQQDLSIQLNLKKQKGHSMKDDLFYNI